MCTVELDFDTRRRGEYFRDLAATFVEGTAVRNAINTAFNVWRDRQDTRTAAALNTLYYSKSTPKPAASVPESTSDRIARLLGEAAGLLDVADPAYKGTAVRTAFTNWTNLTGRFTDTQRARLANLFAVGTTDTDTASDKAPGLMKVATEDLKIGMTTHAGRKVTRLVTTTTATSTQYNVTLDDEHVLDGVRPGTLWDVRITN
jgi:hypothetical protein